MTRRRGTIRARKEDDALARIAGEIPGTVLESEIVALYGAETMRSLVAAKKVVVKFRGDLFRGKAFVELTPAGRVFVDQGASQ